MHTSQKVQLEVELAWMCHQCSASPAAAAAEAIEAKKGDLTIRAMLRHDDPALLEKLRHQPLVR
jgi:hypothetical protein